MCWALDLALNVLTLRLSHPLLKLLIGGYSDNFEYNRKKHMHHTVYFVNKGEGSQWLCIMIFF